MVRDRMGIKPFFYQPTEDGVLFGSEPKAILAHPEVRPSGRRRRAPRLPHHVQDPRPAV